MKNACTRVARQPLLDTGELEHTATIVGGGDLFHGICTCTQAIVKHWLGLSLARRLGLRLRPFEKPLTSLLGIIHLMGKNF